MIGYKGMRPKEQVNLRLEVEVLEKLREIARREDRSVTYIIKRIIRDRFREEEKRHGR